MRLTYKDTHFILKMAVNHEQKPCTKQKQHSLHFHYIYNMFKETL